MEYKHLSQAKRYQIYAPMKAGHDQTQIAKLLNRHKSTFSWELNRNTGSRGYRPKQAYEFSVERAQNSRNAPTVEPLLREEACILFRLQRIPEQITSKLPNCHETMYQYVYAGKVQGGVLWKNLCCQNQKRKRFAGGRDRKGQIHDRRPLSDRSWHIETRRQVGHWECDTVIGASHKAVVVTMIEHKSRYVVIAKAPNKISELVSPAIVSNLKPFAIRVNTLAYYNGIEFAGHGLINQELNSTAYFVRLFAS